MADARPGPRGSRTYPISNPARLKAALDWACQESSLQMVGLPDNHPKVKAGHDRKSAYTVLYGVIAQLARGDIVQLVPDPPDEAARHASPEVRPKHPRHPAR